MPLAEAIVLAVCVHRLSGLLYATHGFH